LNTKTVINKTVYVCAIVGITVIVLPSFVVINDWWVPSTRKEGGDGSDD
jgi:hypothetical protein